MDTLATLGSDKSVTTINAIMTELLTDIKPRKVIILRETPSNKDIRDGLRKALSYLGIEAEIQEKVIGEGVTNWRVKVSEKDVDVFDITPGRKYMALVSAEYSKAKEVRYIYLKNESEGYRIFGYVPFQKLKIFNMRTGEEIKLSQPPITKTLDSKSRLDIESLTALYNILSLHGNVKVKVGERYVEEEEDEFIELCKSRAGVIVYEEEEEIVKAEDAFFLADTNVYN